jgi:hypothetical protein
MTQADPGDRPMPPYEGRRETADVDDPEKLRKDGANVGGATGPVESDEMKAPEPDDTPRGEHASPADEQPAAHSPGDAPAEDEGVGPAHHPGTPKGEKGGA